MSYFLPKRTIYYFVLTVLITINWSCSKDYEIIVPAPPFDISQDAFTLDTLVTGFTIPYGIVQVEENDYFISDRIGKLYRYQNDSLTEITGMPEVYTFGVPGIAAIMHGGLMDISLHPDYANNQWLYISYLSVDGLARVSRIKVKNNTATSLEEIFATRHENYTGNGMRIVWHDNQHFFLNIGNSDWSSQSEPVMFAQDLSHDAGKIHRLKDDGSIPADNPVFDGFQSPGSIWSYGHRDVQGLFYDDEEDILYGVEHGPKGGDEFNIIEKGKNYGWPLFSYGINYDGQWVSLISEDSAAMSTVLPVHWWTVPTHDGGQALGPACLLKVKNSRIDDWNGFYLFGSLAYRRLMKFDPDTHTTWSLDVEGRVRTLLQLPDGDILALIERNDLRKTNGLIVKIGR